MSSALLLLSDFLSAYSHWIRTWCRLEPALGSDADVADAAFDVKEKENVVYVSLSGSGKVENKKHDKKAKRDDIGKSPVGSPIGVRDLRAEFEEFSSNSTNRVNVGSTPVTAIRPNPTNSTNNFNTSSPFDTVVSPNFGIARKSSIVLFGGLPPQSVTTDPRHLLGFTTRADMCMRGARNLSEEFEYFFDNNINGVNAASTSVTTFRKSSYVDPSLDDPDMPSLEDITYSDDEEDVAPQTRSMTRMVKEQGRLTQIVNDDFHTCMFACFLSQEELKREKGIDYEQVFAPVARIEAIRLFLAYDSFMDYMVYQMDVKSAFLYGTIEEEVYVCQPLGFEDPDYPDKVYKVVKALYGLHQASKAWYETLANYLLENGFQRGKIDQTLFIKKQKDGKSASTPIDTEKPLLKDPDGEDVDVYTYRYLKGKPHLGLWYPKDLSFNLVEYSDSDYAEASLDRKSTIDQTVSGKDSSNPLMADNLPKIVWYSTYHVALVKSWLVQKQTDLARMGYEKPSTKVTFYKTFFSAQWKFLFYTILQCMSTKRTAWNEFSSSIALAVISLATGMLVPQQVQDDIDVAVEDKDASAPTLPLPTPATTPPPPQQELVSSPPQEDAYKQGGIAEIDADKDVTLKEVDAEKDAKDDEAEPAELKEVIEVDTTTKLMTEVVTAAATTFTVALMPKANAARRRKDVVIRDPEETATPSVIVHFEPKSRDKGKGVLVEKPKPLKRQAQIEQDEAYARELEKGEDELKEEASKQSKRKSESYGQQKRKGLMKE
uniref:Putative ribonuclease H-like domain-containing protein n=1 Tax=Tanacetum cinerariifolium TaxID=118510 RepID=A0A6L2KAN8_TANCI|nr:putative ribonuclease H-like domain-containing protein [Tanacetum cinerariifolium]